MRMRAVCATLVTASVAPAYALPACLPIPKDPRAKGGSHYNRFVREREYRATTERGCEEAGRECVGACVAQLAGSLERAASDQQRRSGGTDLECGKALRAIAKARRTW